MCLVHLNLQLVSSVSAQTRQLSCSAFMVPTDCEILVIIASHTVWHGSIKLGYNTLLDIWRPYDNTCWIISYKTSQYIRILSLCVNRLHCYLVNIEAKQKHLGLCQCCVYWCMSFCCIPIGCLVVVGHSSSHILWDGDPKFLTLWEFCPRLSLATRLWQQPSLNLSQCHIGPLYWSHDQRYCHVSFTLAIFCLGQPKITQCICMSFLLISEEVYLNDSSNSCLQMYHWLHADVSFYISNI